jgi:hypothetical protein
MAVLSDHNIRDYQVPVAECALPVTQEGSYNSINLALVASSASHHARYMRIYAVYADGQELLYAFRDDAPDGPCAEDNDGGGDFDILYTTTRVCFNGLTIKPPRYPPTSLPGGSYAAVADSPAGAWVTLDGSASFDPDNPTDPAAIAAWHWDTDVEFDSSGDGDPTNDVDATGVAPSCFFPVGQTTISLNVLDSNDGLWSLPVETTVTVVCPPVAVANGPYVAQATSWHGADLVLDGSASYDPDNPGAPDAIVAWHWDLDLAYDSSGDGDPTNDVDATGPGFGCCFPIGQTDISLCVCDKNDGLWSQPEVTTVTVSEVNVAIDIKPDSDENTINMGAHGVVPVAFLSGSGFDASVIDPTTVTLRGEEFSDGFVKLRGKKDPQPMASLTDVDGDGNIDLLVHLEIERLAEHDLTTVCELGALTVDGFVAALKRRAAGLFAAAPGVISGRRSPYSASKRVSCYWERFPESNFLVKRP